MIKLQYYLILSEKLTMFSSFQALIVLCRWCYRCTCAVSSGQCQVPKFWLICIIKQFDISTFFKHLI